MLKRSRVGWSPSAPPNRRDSWSTLRCLRWPLGSGNSSFCWPGSQSCWAALSNSARHRLVQQLSLTELQVAGKTLNQDEFVTCGGVRLSEINFKTMESRVCPGLYLSGELLDIDGLTGGFNFQSAWTTGWLAGRAMGELS